MSYSCQQHAERSCDMPSSNETRSKHDYTKCFALAGIPLCLNKHALCTTLDKWHMDTLREQDISEYTSTGHAESHLSWTDVLVDVPPASAV